MAAVRLFQLYRLSAAAIAGIWRLFMPSWLYMPPPRSCRHAFPFLRLLPLTAASRRAYAASNAFSLGSPAGAFRAVIVWATPSQMRSETNANGLPMRIQLNAHGLPIPSILKCTCAVAKGGCLPPSALLPGVFHGFMACALPLLPCCKAGLPAPPCTHPGCFSWFYGLRPSSLVLLQRGAACPPLHSSRVFFMVLWLAPSLIGAVAKGGCLPPSALLPGVFHGFWACALPSRRAGALPHSPHRCQVSSRVCSGVPNASSRSRRRCSLVGHTSSISSARFAASISCSILSASASLSS